MRRLSKNSQKNLWSWWVIDSWKDAIDLAFKLATIFAIIAAANIFIIKPSFYVEATFQGVVDTENLIAIFNENNIPISNVIQKYMEGLTYPKNFFNPDYIFSGTYEPETLSTQLTSYINGYLVDFEEKKARLYYLRGNFDEVPETEEETFYMSAYRKSMYADITLKIKNATQGNFTDIQLILPEEIEIIQGNNLKFDLAPRQQKTIIFRSKDLQPLSSNISILYDPNNQSFVDTYIIVEIGMFLLLVWIATVVNSIIYKIKYPVTDNSKKATENE